MNRGIRAVIIVTLLELTVCFGLTGATVIFVHKTLNTYLHILPRVLIFICITTAYIEPHFLEEVYKAHRDK